MQFIYKTLGQALITNTNQYTQVSLLKRLVNFTKEPYVYVQEF